MIPISQIMPVLPNSPRTFVSFELHKQNHIHGQCSQTPYEPPGANPRPAQLAHIDFDRPA